MAIKPHFVVYLALLVLALLADSAWAFGAGNIPSFAYLEGKAFRHGDIEDVLSGIAKKGAPLAALGFLSAAMPSTKFGGLDIKRVYFGNWLRDYSQAVDIAALKKLPLQTIINLCMVLGFLAHGYATEEFQVTKERLGCYLPTEHIDNPKGYGEGEDARKYNPGLRPPVDPAELEIDPRTGMKNYIANESGHWDTSKALVRRTLERCIRLGRQARSSGRKEDEYETYRLLGQLLHTLEDFPAHSNFCELALVSFGYAQVFTHVGDHVQIRAPNGRMVAPLVTGTFGSSDFFHSLLGEATDHISQASVSDLNKELQRAKVQSRSTGGGSELRSLMNQIPGIGSTDLGRQMNDVERLGAGDAGKKPEEMSPEELYSTLWQILKFRDSVMKTIEQTIEKIPGLSALVGKLTNAVAVFVLTAIEPFLKPLLQGASTQLSAASAEVVNKADQYEVFNDPMASDPTHSFLSKDHFALILNDPAGKLAQVIVKHAVTMVVKAWDDPKSDPRDAIEGILQCMFHPDFHDSRSPIQREMMQFMSDWVNGLGYQKAETIQKLSKESVRNHKCMRLEDGGPSNPGGAGYNAGVQAQQKISGYVNQIPGVSQAQSIFGSAGGTKDGGPAPAGSGPPFYTPPPGPPPVYFGGPAAANAPYAPPPGPPPHLVGSPGLHGAPDYHPSGPQLGFPAPGGHHDPHE
ncbi:uncharacterized protein EI90DRAFT_2926740 [Cantharellus anzutake]|uniref:uncharacterized protein n=1 Tax=Cantharellus anzutake TaxID=1750568 RepID=UPI001905FA90|nr:uncharacterized protein EI90DRAFT_2926740 [Cantharellus anzutake]KAF8328217.1 hypothetical protein EI90DRAFT_2926740 [Cantharellus anzutake]